MTKRTTGQLISLAYVLHGAAEPFTKPEGEVEHGREDKQRCLDCGHEWRA